VQPLAGGGLGGVGVRAEVDDAVAVWWPATGAGKPCRVLARPG
jgi:hypothetical protein